MTAAEIKIGNQRMIGFLPCSSEWRTKAVQFGRPVSGLQAINQFAAKAVVAIGLVLLASCSVPPGHSGAHCDNLGEVTFNPDKPNQVAWWEPMQRINHGGPLTISESFVRTPYPPGFAVITASRWPKGKIRVAVSDQLANNFDYSAASRFATSVGYNVEFCTHCAPEGVEFYADYACERIFSEHEECKRRFPRNLGDGEALTRLPHHSQVMTAFSANWCKKCESIVLMPGGASSSLEIMFADASPKFRQVKCLVDPALSPSQQASVLDGCWVRAFGLPQYFSKDKKSAYYRDPLNMKGDRAVRFEKAKAEIETCRAQGAM